MWYSSKMWPSAVGTGRRRRCDSRSSGIWEFRRERTDSAAYLRDRFGEFDQLATAQIERYGYLGDRIAFECGAMSACTLRFGDGYLELIKPGVINEHIVRYNYVAAN